MNRKSLYLALSSCIALPILACVCCTGVKSGGKLPCDIYSENGTPCVTAHSTTRLLYSKYNGPLYQVRRASDGQTLDIKATPDGYADAAAQDRFCEGTIGYITVIYDQSGLGNDLKQAAPGTFKGPDTGEFNTASIADMAPVLVNGHKAYGAFIMPGMGYRCNNAQGLAIDDEPEGMYYVIDGKHYDSGCCFDYGNSSTNGKAVGTGTMETTYFGTSTAWGRGNGEGPWIMSDMEAGLFSGYNVKQNDVPSIDNWEFVSVFMNGGGGNQWDLRGSDANCDTLITFYSGVRPKTPESDEYYPMHKKGAMLLGNGGDNGNGSSGTFYEGIMTFGYPTDDAINAVQKNIASVSYTKYPINITRIKSFTPGQKQSVTVVFTNVTGKTLKNVQLTASLPEGWAVEGPENNHADLAPGEHVTEVYTLVAPQGRSAGFADFTANWKGSSLSVSERVRCTEAIRINEVKLADAEGALDQYIELYNASDAEVDLSGINVEVRRSGWAPVSAAVVPSGAKLGAGEFYLIKLAPSAVTAPAAKGSTEILLSSDVKAGAKVMIGAQAYNVQKQGVPAGAFTTIFSPISTGPWLSIPAGATNIPATSVAGFAEGQKMGIDLGGKYEIVTVTSVGTPSTQTNLAAAAKAGDTQISIGHTSALIPGSEITINTGARIEKAVVKSVLKVAEAPAPHVVGFRDAPHEPGLVELMEPLKMDHMLDVDVSCPGTGISFTPATKYDHLSGQALQPLGTEYTLSEALAADAAAYQGVCTANCSADLSFGYSLSQSAGSIALKDAATGAVFDAIVYGSQQSNSSGNGTITSPELATLEGEQGAGGCIAVVPPAPRRFPFTRPGMPKPQPVPARVLVRFPDGADTDNLCQDFTITDIQTPASANRK